MKLIQQIRERLERDFWRSYAAVVCGDCWEPIIRQDDDARICIECGGRNRRAPKEGKDGV